MLVIRQAQIDALIKGSDEEFEDFLMAHAREEFPEKTADRDDATLRMMVKSGIKRAESHEFTRAEDITAFVSVMFEIAPNFDDQPQIRAVLANDAFPPDSRLEQIWSPAVPDEAWEQAVEMKDDEAWSIVS